MTKRDKKIEVIRMYIKNVGGTWPAYSYGKIPTEKVTNACKSYAGAVQSRDVLGLIDITIAGNGKKGIVFTDDRVYFDNGFLEQRGSFSYRQVNESEKIPINVYGSSYNKQALRELISMLAQIDEESLQGMVDSVNNKLDSFNQGIDSVTDTIEKVSSIVGSFMRLIEKSNNNQSKNK